jgi:hypothetical protein
MDSTLKPTDTTIRGFSLRWRLAKLPQLLSSLESLPQAKWSKTKLVNGGSEVNLVSVLY